MFPLLRLPGMHVERDLSLRPWIVIHPAAEKGAASMQGFERLVLDGIDCGVLVAGGGGSVLFANNKAAALFGRDMTGQCLMDARFEDDLPLVAGVVESYRRALTEAGISRNLLIDVGEEETRYFWVAISPAPVEGEGDGARIVTVQEVTEPLIESPAIRKVFSQVNHDLRSPLTSIAGAAELLLSGRVGAVDGVQRRLVRIVEEGTQKMSAILARTKSDLIHEQQAAGGEGVE